MSCDHCLNWFVSACPLLFDFLFLLDDLSCWLVKIDRLLIPTFIVSSLDIERSTSITVKCFSSLWYKMLYT